MRSIHDYDAIYISREASLLDPPIFERWIHRAGRPIIFDFDDAIFVPYRSPANGTLSLLKMAGKTRTICRMAPHVIVGNRYLAECARQVNTRVTVANSGESGMRRRIRILALVFIALLPGFLKRALYRWWFGYRIGNDVRIGFAYLGCAGLSIGDHSSISHGAIFWRCGEVDLE